MNFADIPTPALVVNLDRLDRNLSMMATRASNLGVALRPHVKTHKCVEIGRLQIDAGASGITVSTLEEAQAFAAAGFEDITWAFPVGPSRCSEAAELAGRIRLGVVVDSLEAVDWLASQPADYKVWIKIDCGYHRAGAPPQPSAILPIVESLHANHFELAGLLSHSGNAYDVSGSSAHGEIADAEARTITGLAESLRASGVTIAGISTGSTPGCTGATDLSGVTEIRPGNYAFFDRFQQTIGSCGPEDIAVSVLSTVVSRGADHAICDAGALTMSKDPGPEDGSFGHVWADHEAGEFAGDLRLVSLSQEHGKLSKVVALGERLRIAPNHSCLTVACFANVYAVRGQEVVDRWRIWNGR